MPLSPPWRRGWAPRFLHGSQRNAIAFRGRNYRGRWGQRKELDAWKQFRALGPFKECDISKGVVSNRWVPSWKVAHGEKCVKVRLAAEARRGPDVKDSSANVSGCVSLRSTRLHAIPRSHRKREASEPRYQARL